MSHNYCMQRTAGRVAGVISRAALAGRRWCMRYVD